MDIFWIYFLTSEEKLMKKLLQNEINKLIFSSVTLLPFYPILPTFFSLYRIFVEIFFQKLWQFLDVSNLQ